MKKINNAKIGIKNSEKTILLSNLATLIGAGVTIAEAIDLLQRDAKGNMKIVLESMQKDVHQGKRIYVAFSQFPLIFDSVTLSVLKASEEAGKIHLALKYLKDNLKKQNDFTNKVVFAMLYPVIISIIFAAVFLLLLIYVIPQFANVFKQLKVTIPLPTKILFYLSNSLLTYKWFYLSGVILIVSGLILLYKKKKKAFFNFFMSLPLIKELIIKIDLTRFMYNLHVLLLSGITIINSLELLRDSVFNKSVRKMIVDSQKIVEEGKHFSVGLTGSAKIIPPLMIKLIEAGEVSGSLHQATKDASEYLDSEVINTLTYLTALLEPIILVLVAVVIGGMLVAIITPIYGIIGQIGGT